MHNGEKSQFFLSFLKPQWKGRTNPESNDGLFWCPPKL